nr:DUF1554 domain-containing protein [Leptospira chreensis]
MNNPCDPSSKDYATGIALKIASNNSKSYCDFNTRNADNTASLPCSPCRIFVTATPYSGGSSEHLDWVMQPNKSYIRVIGAVVIGTTNINGLLIAQSNPVSASSVTTWLGFNVNWPTEPGLHCSDWMVGTNAITGTLNNQNTNPIIGSSTNTCDNPHSLICVEQ